MNEIMRIAVAGLIGGLISVFLKNYKKEYAMLCAAATSVILLSMAAEMCSDVITGMKHISQMGGIKSEYITVIIKTIAVAYISDFSGQLLSDAGENAIAKKVELCGRLAILYFTFPVITEFMEVCIDAINAI